MVITRSQTLQGIRTEQLEMETFNDNESNANCYVDLCLREQYSEHEEENMRTQEGDHEILRIEQRFMDVHHQIGYLTSIV